MSISRRTFLAGPASAFAARLFAGSKDSKSPNPELEDLADVALRQAKKLKASYCDIRIGRYRNQNVMVRISPVPGSEKPNEVPVIVDRDSFGFGVRVIVDGAWGFAASSVVTSEEIARITAEAVTVARASATLNSTPVVLAPAKAYKERWTSRFEQNPFDVPIAGKLTLLLDAAREVKAGRKIFGSAGWLRFDSTDKYFASSEGASIQQLIVQTNAVLLANAVDIANRLSRIRNYTPPPLSAGYEYVAAMNWKENALRIREEVVEHLQAPPVKPGRKDLVLLPSNLSLTIHESIGHSTELDRALGFEANRAGTSFLTVDKRGRERVGSGIVSLYGDRITPRGLATAAFDDDGVKTTKFPIISKGIFVGYQTTREQAHLIGEKESRGCSYADSWSSVPFQRMPNVSLEPGQSETTLVDLIAGVDDGILIDGRGSYSIDQQRYNFQFGGDAFYEIRGGKQRGMLSRVAYQSRTPDFWLSCDGIAGPAYWQLYGLLNDGKGEPPQSNAMSHGCSPARFRQVNVVLTD